MKRNGVAQRILIATIPAAVFLCATLANLQLPGIQYDELYYVPPAAALLKNQLDAEYVMLDPSVIHLFGKPLPLMFNYYTSFLRTYLTLPIFAIFGINVESIRGSSIALGTASLLFLVAFTSRLTKSSAIAFATGLLLAVDASFVAYVRNDFAVIATMMAIKSIALWALLRWWQDGEARHLYLGVFMVGLGITDRASFLWIPMAMVPAMMIIYRQEFFAELRRRVDSMKKVVFTVVSFAAGAAIFLAFNIATLGGTFTPMLGNFGQTSGGANNFAFFQNLHLRLQMLVDVLGGDYFNHFVAGDLRYQTSGWNFSGSPLSWLAPLAFVCFFVMLLVGKSRKLPGLGFSVVKRRPLLFVMLMNVLLLVYSCFTPTLHRGHQLLILYPFPHLLVALLIFEIAQLLKRWQYLRETAVVGLVLIVAISGASARSIFAYHQMLQETGGRGPWSDAIYEIIEEVDRHPGRIVVCMDWGFNANILSLTKNPVKTVRNYYVDTRRSPEKLAELFDARHSFLFHSPEYTLIPEARADFLRAIQLSGANVDTLKIFYQRDGRSLAALVRVLSKN